MIEILFLGSGWYLSGENLKWHILTVSQGVDILKTSPSAPPPIPLSLMIRNFKISEGRPTRSDCNRD
jgi:hypothetical protein